MGKCHDGRTLEMQRWRYARAHDTRSGQATTMISEPESGRTIIVAEILVQVQLRVDEVAVAVAQARLEDVPVLNADVLGSGVEGHFGMTRLRRPMCVKLDCLLCGLFGGDEEDDLVLDGGEVR